MNFEKIYISIITLLIMCQGSQLLAYETTHHQSDSLNIQNVKVFYENGMYGGWPANNGIWIWENEILVGFTKGHYKDHGIRHHMDREKPELHLFGRSLDGGESWTIEDPGKTGNMVPHGLFMAVPRTDLPIDEPQDCQEITFTHPDFALTARTDNTSGGESRYWYSYDRGHQWEGSCRLPNFGTAGTAARTDYIINNNNDAMLFITASKTNGRVGRPLVIQTTNGGREWSFLSWIGPEPEGFSIMPASARLSDNEILVTVRRGEDPDIRFISTYLSTDNGSSWTHLNDPVDVGIGNPPAMIKLKDGRIALTYAYRSDSGSHLGIKFSSDNGRSWSEELVLRDNDGADRDVGYPRIVQRPDGKLVIIYYWNHALMDDKPPYRYIAATIFDPPETVN